jgi:hypothetical protein
MKLRNIFLAVAYVMLSAGFLSSCDSAFDESLDINRDPLEATSADPNGVLPFVFTEYSARKVSELGTRISDVPHHVNETFNSPKNGGNVSSFLTGNTWRTWYTGLLGNLELVKQDAEAAGAPQNNVNAVARIMQAHLFFELTCIWEEVPYTQALDGNQFQQPEFDDQETILKGVVSDLDSAILLIDNMPESGNFDFSFGDLIYDGDISLWRKLAVSMKIRTLMLIRNADPGFADPLLQDILGADTPEYLTENSEAAFFTYVGGSGARNAQYNIVNQFFGPSNEGALIFGPSPTMRDLLIDTNDPRADIWMVDLSGTGDFPVDEYPAFPAADETVYSDNLIRETLPDIYFLPGEIDFYRAELAVLGVLPGTDANEAFENGVTKTLEYWGGEIDGYEGPAISSGQVQTYIDGRSFNGLSDDGKLTEIYNQLYLETFLRPVVAWNHIRRTNTPALDPPPAAVIPVVLQRFTYPPDEVGSNANTPANKPTDQPMWFAAGSN